MIPFYNLLQTAYIIRISAFIIIINPEVFRSKALPFTKLKSVFVAGKHDKFWYEYNLQLEGFE